MMPTAGFLASKIAPTTITSTLALLLTALILATTAAGEPQGDAPAPFLRSTSDEPITTYRQVTWDDFQAALPLRGSAQARIFSGIRLEGFDFDIQAEGSDWVARPEKLVLYSYMDRTRSSAKPGDRKPSVLAHEQLHFDITEIFARRLYRDIAALEGRGTSAHAAMADLNRRVNQLYDESLSRWQQTQNRYDRETRHGMSKRQQKEWSERIHEWLEQAGEAPTIAR